MPSKPFLTFSALLGLDNLKFQEKVIVPTRDEETDSQRRLLWTFPLISAVVAFGYFPWVTANFHKLVQWVSGGTWIPETDHAVSLQASVVTQVVNGPVITSISLLFATLVSTTISTLHQRQVDIQKSLIDEAQAIRYLQRCLSVDHARVLLGDEALADVQTIVSRLTDALIEADWEKLNPSIFIELYGILPELMEWSAVASLAARRRWARRLNGSHVMMELDTFLIYIRRLAESILENRSTRWFAATSMRFPSMHYMTLYLLASSIAISFLVATDEAEFIFLRGLPIRILWTLLISSFSALAVVIFDLADAFHGAYHVRK